MSAYEAAKAKYIDESLLVTDRACPEYARRNVENATAMYQAADAELARLREVENKYQELLYQVASKFPDESRHDTAKRYIHDAEHRDIGPEKTDCG